MLRVVATVFIRNSCSTFLIFLPKKGQAFGPVLCLLKEKCYTTFKAEEL